MHFRNATILFGLSLAATALAVAQDRDAKVRDDKSRFESDDTWIYGDLDLAVSLAKNEKKPLMVVFRCIP